MPTPKSPIRLLLPACFIILAAANLILLTEHFTTPALASPTEIGDDDAKTPSLAFFHIGKAIGPLMDSDEFKEEREDIDADFADREKAYRDRYTKMQEEFAGLKPDDPEAAAAQQQYAALMEEIRKFEAERNASRGTLLAGQLERAYQEILAAVDVVAEKKNIDIVFRFVPPSDEFKATSPEQAYLALRARTALKYPEDLDITPAVLEELNLEED